MDSKRTSLVRMVREQPLLFITFFVVAILFVVVLIVANNRRNTAETTGDQASPTSAAFLVYNDDTFLPTTNNFSNSLIRADLAYLARTNFDIYNPEKNPAVIFRVSKFSPIDNGKLSFSGSYEKQKGDITVEVTLQANDRVVVKILSDDSKVSETRLPSASNRNVYIAKLPLETSKYSVSYSSSSDSFVITVFSVDEAVITEAKNDIKKELVDDYRETDIGVYYPAYLKGDPAYDNPQEQYVPEEEYGDGGAPVGTN